MFHHQPAEAPDDNIYIAAQAVTRASHNGPKEDALCVRCSNGQTMERIAPKGVQGDKVVWCRAIGRSVPHDIVKCTNFSDAKEMPLHQMEAIALDVSGSKHHADQAFNDGSYR